MAERKKQPELRFKGFSGDWEERVLENEVEFYSGLTYSPSDVIKEGGSFVLRSSNVKNGEIIDADNVYVNSNVVNSDNVREGDVIVVVRNGSRSLIGKHAQIKKRMNNTVIGAFMTGLHSKESAFINALLDTTQYNKEIEKNLGATINQITTGAFKKMQFMFPDTNEQTSMGLYFQNLDNLITLQQHKLDKLINIKKALLEKMFPKNGAVVPEIRFKGFCEDWEERELGTIFNKIRNAFVGTASPYYVNEGHFYLESNNVKNGQINRNSEIFINDAFYEKQKDNWLHTGDMVMVQSGHVGHAAIIPPELDNTAAHALIIFAEPKERISPYFLNYQFQTEQYKKEIANITTGNTIKHILSSEMKKFEVLLPKYDEQAQIGVFFQHLDNLITLHQLKLEKLKNIKKACLEKMFV